MTSMMDDIMKPGDAIEDQSRRLLIYILLDISGSMCGAPLAAVNDGVDLMLRALKDTPEALLVAHLCFISFESNAHLVMPLTPLTQIESVPHLACAGSTNMTAALELVAQQIDKDFQPNFRGQARGDYKPLIFMLTDGEPNSLSSAVAAAERLRNRPSGKKIGTFMALGCGSGANRSNLEQITRPVAMMVNMTPENIKEFFVWMSATIKGASVRASQQVSDDSAPQQFTPPPPPQDADGTPVFTF